MVTSSMGANPLSMILPIQQISAMGRAALPVAACMIVAVGGAKLSTIDVVKRKVVPVTLGFVVNFIACGYDFCLALLYCNESNSPSRTKLCLNIFARGDWKVST